MFEDLLHHLFAPPNRRHLEEDREDHTAEDVIQETDPHTGVVGNGFLQDRIISGKPVEPAEVLICPET